MIMVFLVDPMTGETALRSTVRTGDLIQKVFPNNFYPFKAIVTFETVD
jgi:hypothetical protein